MARSFNQVILMGNLTRDPELRQTPNGQNVCSFSLALLVCIEPGVLISDGQLRGDGNEKSDFFVRPMTGSPRMMQANQTEHLVIKHNRKYQKRARPEAPGEEPNLVIKLRRRCVIELDWLSHIEVLRKRLNVHRNARLQV